jgi:hypothetical protein
LCPLGAFLFPLSELLFLDKAHKTFKTKKEERTMAIKKSMWVLVGIFIIAAWLLGFAIEAKAETMKCRTASVTTKVETLPVSDVEGTTLSMRTTEGVAFFENGEIADFKAYSIGDATAGKGFQAIGYNYITFEDGSKIITKFDMRVTADSSGKISIKSANEFIKGTGRFEGIKGIISGTGNKIPYVKDGPLKISSDVTFTYTLPPK